MRMRRHAPCVDVDQACRSLQRCRRCVAGAKISGRATLINHFTLPVMPNFILDK